MNTPVYTQAQLNMILKNGIEDRSIERVKKALHNGADANALDGTERTMVYQCLNCSDDERHHKAGNKIFELLLQAGADVEKENSKRAQDQGSTVNCLEMINDRCYRSRQIDLALIYHDVTGKYLNVDPPVRIG